jgi:flagellar hook-length control protein FliK
MIKLQLVDQTATVNFVSPHATVRDALEQQVARLQEMFREQGMSLLDVSVSDQSTNSRQESERQTAGRGNSSNVEVPDSTEPENLESVRQSSSLVDYYA